MNNLRLLICAALWLPFGTAGQAQEYQWSRMSTGGGGYMTGIQFHPKVPGLKYVRTDVAVPFRMDPGSDSWVYTGDEFSPAFERLEGSDGFALHPTDPNTIFAFIGLGLNSPQRGLYRSFDRGETWEKVLDVYTNGNNKPTANVESRAQGEPLAIDPNNTDYIYAGTQQEGLFRTTTGGGAGTWASIGNIPNFQGVGIRNVAIDSNFTVDNPTRSQYIYVNNFSEGIYLSTDGGETYSLMPSSPTATATRMRMGPDGNLYMSTLNGFWKYTPGTPYENGVWENISPNGPTSTANFTAFDVRAAANGLEFLVAQKTQKIWRKQGDAAAWELISVADGTITEKIINGFKNVRDVGAGTISDIKFDPFSDDVWFTDVFMVWKSTNVWDPVTEWAPQYKNITNTITIDLSAPPASEVVDNGILYTAHPDVEGFRFDSTTEPWSVKYTGLGPNATSIDFCEEYPEVMYFCKTTKWAPKYQGRVFRSDDGIDPANRPPEVSETFIPEEFYSISFPHDDASTSGVNEGIGIDVGGAKIAVSATDPMNAVYFSGGEVKGTRYTMDGGATWQDCQGLPNGGFLRRPCPGCSEYDFPMPIAADRIAGNVFYAFYDIDHTFWKSTDHGANWTKMEAASQDLPAWIGNSQYDPYRLAAAPYIAGTVWIALDDNGLYTSSDFGESFTKISYFDKANQVAWGKNKPGHSNPATYVYGLKGSQWGTYRSTDLGDTWELISPPNLPGGYPRAMAADRQVYGRVYLGQVTTGVRFGELNTPPVADTPPAAPTLRSVTAASSASVQITWQDNADNELKYRIYRKAAGESEFTKVGLAGYNDTTYTDKGLVPQTTYTYRVEAWNDGGEASSDTLSDETLAPLTDLTLSATCAQYPDVDRRWEVNNPNPSPVSIDWTVAGTPQQGSFDAPPGLSYFVTDATEDNSVATITWTDEFATMKSSSDTSVSTQCDLPVPAAPQDVAATNAPNANPTDADLRLSWTDAATNEDVYEIERQNDNGVYEQIAILDSGATSYTDQGLAINKTFRYRIRAFNKTLGHSQYVSARGTTANSYYEIVSAPAGKRLSPDNPFANGTAVRTENRNFFAKQQWVFEPAPGGDYYIRNKPANKVLTVRNPGNSSDASLYDADGTGNQRWKLSKTSADPSNTKYYIVAENNKVLTADNPFANKSGVSAETNIFFGKQQWQFVPVATIEPVAPSVPDGLAATGGQGEIALNWSNNAGNIAGYLVYRSTVSGGPYALQSSAPLASSAFTDKDVKDGVAYYYVVTAVDNNGVESANSAEASGTTALPLVGDCSFVPEDFPGAAQIVAVSEVTYVDFSRNRGTYVVGIATGIREDGLAGAWEIHNDCSVQPVRRTGQGDRTTRLPDVRGVERNRGWKYVPTAISEDGQYIYATAINEAGFTHPRGWAIAPGTTVDVRFKLGGPFYGRIFGISSEILCDDLQVETFAGNFFVTGCNDSTQSSAARTANREKTIIAPQEGDWSKQFRAYPNPAAEQLTVEAASSEDYRVTMYDMTGRRVMQYEHLRGTRQLDISHIRPGLYMIKVRSADQHETQQRVIIE